MGRDGDAIRIGPWDMGRDGDEHSYGTGERLGGVSLVVWEGWVLESKR